jgi:hypothetical protein
MRDYQGISTGLSHDPDFMDWFLCAVWFLMGIIPAIIWWYYVIHSNNFYVALNREHGFPDVILYRGLNQALTVEIAEKLEEVTGLPFDRG